MSPSVIAQDRLSTQVSQWHCCPTCKEPLLLSQDQASCARCRASYPVTFGILDFRQAADTTAGFDAQRDLAIARTLEVESVGRSYFELYERYCAIVGTQRAPVGCAQQRRMQRADAHYRRLLRETHLQHGQAILEKVSWYSAGMGRPWPIGGIALEDGAGLGQFVYGFAQRFDAVIVLDISMSYLLLCRKLLDEHALTNVVLICGNVERLPVRTGVVDFVHFNNMIEHVTDPRAAVAEACRVLRDEGLALVVSPNRHSLYVEPHFRCPAFGWFPRWVQKRLASWCRGTDVVEDIQLRSLPELRRILRDAWKGPYAISFIPRYLPQTVRQTWMRRLVVLGLRTRMVGALLHGLLNRALLTVMPYHVVLCFKRSRAAR